MDEVKTEVKNDAKKNWVNPIISWGSLILEVAIIAVICFIVFKG